MCRSEARASSSRPSQRRVAVGGREVREHLFDAHRVEHRLRFAQPDAGRRDAQQDASPVAADRDPAARRRCRSSRSIASDIVATVTPMWPARSVIDIGVDLVEVIEDARLMRADSARR